MPEERPQTPPGRVVVIGGGISGLTAAYELAKRGVECTLVETSERLGGVIRTDRVEDCLVEGGPDSFIAQKPWALELIREAPPAFDDALAREFAVMTRLIEEADFSEGIRALLIDKDRAPRWQFAAPDSVDKALVDSILAARPAAPLVFP